MKFVPFAVGVLLSVAALVSPASADFAGSTIQAQAAFGSGPPGTPGNFESPPVQAVVGPGVEFTNGQFGAFAGPSFDFGADTIAITSVAIEHSAAPFNGYGFFDVFATIDPITSVSIINDTTGFFSGDPSRISFDADHVFINFEGLVYPSDSLVQLQVGFNAAAVPGPMVGAGLPGLIMAAGALLAWRRRKQAA